MHAQSPALFAVHGSTVPLERLKFFRSQLGIDKDMVEALAPYAPDFAARAPELAEDLYGRFANFAQTKLMLDKESSPGQLKRSWEVWFKALWTHPLEEPFMNMVWRSGVIHVTLGIDQRFINLAFSHARTYCRNMVRELVPLRDQFEVLKAVNALIDFNLLVETDSFVESTQHCETEMVMGVAHQLRNPLMVIGAGAHKLGRTDASCMSLSMVTETILDEAQRIERMLKSVGEYTRLLQRKPSFAVLELSTMVKAALAEAQTATGLDLEPEMDLDPAEPGVEADPAFVQPLLREVLGNCLEAAHGLLGQDGGPDAPWIRVASGTQGATTGYLRITLDNNGPEPAPGTIESLFEPFHSTKPLGTGFGLPIARLAAKKCLGSLTLEPLPGRGARIVLQLPLPGTWRESELFAGD